MDTQEQNLYSSALYFRDRVAREAVPREKMEKHLYRATHFQKLGTLSARKSKVACLLVVYAIFLQQI